jgi:outer membrane protein assembly factor BamB
LAGVVAVLGTNGPVPLDRVIVLAANDGAALWTSAPAWATEIASDGEAVYIGGISGGVERRSPLTGDISWYRLVSSPRRVFALHVFGPWVYAYFNPDLLVLLDKASGQPIDPPMVTSLNTVHLLLPFLAVGDSLRVEDLVTHTIMWSVDDERRILETPLVVTDVLVSRSGEQVGRVTGLDISTGRTIWESEDNVVSNLALLGHGVVFLDSEGAVRVVDADTGSDSVLAVYGGGALVLPTELDGTVGGYYVATDTDSGRIYVLLGDSGQLDSFTVDPPPQLPEDIDGG